MSSREQTNGRKLAMVTGASTGIGYELAILCAKDGFDLIVVADEPEIEEAAKQFRNYGVEVTAVQADLATREGVDKFYDAAKGRQVEALLANAGHGLGGVFLDQDFDDVKHVIDTNVTGTVLLDPEGWQRHAFAWAGSNSDHGIDRGFHAGHVQRCLQCE